MSINRRDYNDVNWLGKNRHDQNSSGLHFPFNEFIRPWKEWLSHKFLLHILHSQFCLQNLPLRWHILIPLSSVKIKLRTYIESFTKYKIQKEAGVIYTVDLLLYKILYQLETFQNLMFICY